MLKAEIKAGNLAYDRVLFFSDAVFAIAITLLVVDIRVPEPVSGLHSGQQLREAAPAIVGVVISFAVIGLFWIAHHTLFRHIVALNRTLIALNLLFLATIAFLPYPTALLSATSGQAPATIFYAVCASAAGLSELGLWLYALRSPTLVSPDLPPALRRYITLRILRTPVVFLLSVPVAAVAPAQAPYTWLLIAVIGLILRRSRRQGAGGADEDSEERPGEL